VRTLITLGSILVLAGCGGAPAAKNDPTTEPWYRQTVAELVKLNREAKADYDAGKRDDASTVIQKAEPLEKKLVSVGHPSHEAVEAASDLDDLYGRMLLDNRHYGWARLMFQKNLNRWKHWDPQTEETRRRYQLALTEIAECDKHIDE
jgi:hypothetical protein